MRRTNQLLQLKEHVCCQPMAKIATLLLQEPLIDLKIRINWFCLQLTRARESQEEAVMWT